MCLPSRSARSQIFCSIFSLTCCCDTLLYAAGVPVDSQERSEAQGCLSWVADILTLASAGLESDSIGIQLS